jgi:hypothetical protein
MKPKYTHIAASLILALSLPSIASAAVVTIPTGIADGSVSSFTIGVGDSSTDVVYIASTTDAVATLNVNGSWNVSGSEIQLGGLYADDSGQNATLNIGTTGVVTIGAFWVAGGWSSAGAPGSTPGTATINIAQGGQLVLNGGFGVRATYNLPSSYPTGYTVDGAINGETGATASALAIYTMLWNQGVLQKDGANTGTFGDNFSYSGGATAGTLTAIPEPSTALLGGLGMLALLRRRRA